MNDKEYIKVLENALEEAVNLAYSYRENEDSLSCSSCDFAKDCPENIPNDKCPRCTLYDTCPELWKYCLIERAKKNINR